MYLSGRTLGWQAQGPEFSGLRYHNKQQQKKPCRSLPTVSKLCPPERVQSCRDGCSKQKVGVIVTAEHADTQAGTGPSVQ